MCSAPLPTPINAANAPLDTKKPDTKDARFQYFIAYIRGAN